MVTTSIEVEQYGDALYHVLQFQILLLLENILNIYLKKKNFFAFVLKLMQQ